MRLALVLALAALALLAAAWRYGPPAPLPASAPDAEFSAIRAENALARILGDGEAHPVGSPAAARVRERIVAELEAMGYAPRVQRSFTCGRHGACAFVVNVVAELAGASRDAVLLSAHYDSVHVGSGANDDGSGVASVLEIARALRASPPPARSFLFLFDEGEEEGLLGALAFAEADPERERVKAVVNLDARGSRGPAMVFETGWGSSGVIGLVARAVPRPVTSSLYSMVYRRMPNDTDFSVWRARLPGANLAFLGHIEHYHTALDRLETTDPGTIQQQGEGALALTRALASADLTKKDDSVWFDVLALGVVRWDSAWTQPLAALAFLLVAVAVARQMRHVVARSPGEVTPSQVLTGLGAVPLALGGAGFLGAMLTEALTSSIGRGTRWPANGPWVFAAMWTCGIAAAATASLLLSRAGRAGQWAGTWVTLALAGSVVAWSFPGASYLLIVPALAAGCFGIAASKRSPAVVVGAPAIVAILAWGDVLFSLYDVAGLAIAPVAAVIAALLAGMFAPLLQDAKPARVRFLAPGALALVTLLLAAVAASAAPFSPTIPNRANVVFAEDASGARVMIDRWWRDRDWGPLPPELRAAMGPTAHDAPFSAWAPHLVWTIDAPPSHAPPPEVTAVATSSAPSGRRVTLHVRSLRGARTIGIVLSGASTRIARIETSPGPPAYGAALRIEAVPAEGVSIELDTSSGPADVTVYDETQDLPPFAAPVAAARPATVTPYQRGDVTIVSRHAAL